MRLRFLEFDMRLLFLELNMRFIYFTKRISYSPSTLP